MELGWIVRPIGLFLLVSDLSVCHPGVICVALLSSRPAAVRVGRKVLSQSNADPCRAPLVTVRDGRLPGLSIHFRQRGDGRLRLIPSSRGPMHHSGRTRPLTVAHIKDSLAASQQ